MSPGRIALAAAVAALLSLERKAFLQAMLARPLVACPILGAVLGHPAEGVLLGAALELFFLGTTNLGAAMPDHELLAAVVAVGCTAALREGGWSPAASMLLGALVGLPAAKFGRAAERASEQFNAQLETGAYEEPLRLLRRNLRGLWLPASAAAVALLAGVALGLLLRRAIVPAPGSLRALGWGWLGFEVAAAAIAVRAVRSVRAGLIGGVAAVAAASAQALGHLAP